MMALLISDSAMIRMVSLQPGIGIICQIDHTKSMAPLETVGAAPLVEGAVHECGPALR